MNPDEIAEVIEDLHRHTFREWEYADNDPDWEYVETNLKRVCAQLVLRQAKRDQIENAGEDEQ